MSAQRGAVLLCPKDGLLWSLDARLMLSADDFEAANDPAPAALPGVGGSKVNLQSSPSRAAPSFL